MTPLNCGQVWAVIFGVLGGAFVVVMMILAIKFDIGNTKRIYMPHDKRKK